MEKTIFNIMSDDIRRIDTFKAACDDMMNTQYILVDSKITSILQSIATSSVLYSLFSKLLKDFDYKGLAKSCLVNNETEFRTPQEPKKIACLVFCILLDMDKKNIELRDFLQFFKRIGDINSAYEIFLKEVIAPFKNSVIYLYNQSLNDPDAKEQNEAQETNQSSLNEDTQSYEHIISVFVTRINADNNPTDMIKQYLTGLFNDLLDALNSKDSHKARNIYNILSKRLKTHNPNLYKEFEKTDITSLMAR